MWEKSQWEEREMQEGEELECFVRVNTIVKYLYFIEENISD